MKVHQWVATRLRAIAGLAFEAEAKSMYASYTDNHPTIHSNRFPSWSGLTEIERDQWRDKAAAR